MIKTTNKDTFEIISSAVNKLVDFVKPTYGPASNKVIINKFPYSMVVDDGVQIARDFELEDPYEQSVVRLVRETAVRTNDRVGDGTTGALIMLQAIINEVAKKYNRSGHKLEKELELGLKDAIQQLRKTAKTITTKEELRKVARISFDNEEIANMIADLYYKLGKDAVITIDKSPTMETYAELSNGVHIPHGYISPYMITNPDRMETVLEKPYILFTDYRLTEVNDVLPIMEQIANSGKRELLIVAENVEQHALATVITNKLEGKFLAVAVVHPKGDNGQTQLNDMAILTGGRVFTHSGGHKLENATLADLGQADRVVCRRQETILVGPKGNKKRVKDAIDSLTIARSIEKNTKEKTKLESRLAMFRNKMAVIKVGASTENEQIALKYKVEDAVHAVKAAYNGGVVCGSGIALANITTSSPILNEALKYPARQLRENMGLDLLDLKKGYAHNVVTDRVGHFMDVGVIDPVDALVAGVESAVSIASILLTSSGMIVEVADKE